MGAGFGHTFCINGEQHGAIEVRTVGFPDWDDVEDEYGEAWGLLKEDIEAVINPEGIEIPIGNTSIHVQAKVESTYNGDGFCIVPKEEEAYELLVYKVYETFLRDVDNSINCDLYNTLTGAVDEFIERLHLEKLFNDGVINAFNSEGWEYRVRTRGFIGTSWSVAG